MKKRDWKKVKLGDLMLKRNKSVNPAKFKEEFFELYSIPAYSTEQAEIIQGSSIGSSKKTVEEDDVLLSRIVPHIQRCWIVPEKKELRQIASGEWIVFRSEKVLSNYLRFFLLSKPFHKRFMGTVRGVGGSLMRADPKQVADFQIPLPPIPEQKAIAAQLDRADKLRQALAQSLKDYDRLLAASFLDMFGDPVLNPKGWELVKLRELANIVTKNIDPKESPYNNQLHVGGANIESGTGTLVNLQTAKDEGLTSHKFPFSSTHLLYSRIRPYLNKVALPNFTGICSSDIYPIEVVSQKAHKFFITLMLRSNYFLGYAENNTTGSNIPRMGRAPLLNFPIPLPPLSLQQQFAQLVDRIERQKALIRSAQQSAEDLFGALLQAYFYEGK